MREKIRELTIKADIFGDPISLRINKETSAKTTFGGLMTVLLIITLISVFWLFCLDVLYHLNPSISLEQQILEVRPNIILNSTSMPMAFGVSNSVR